MPLKNKCTLKGIVQAILHYKKELIVGNTATLIATLFTVVTPLLIPILVDELLLGKNHGLSLFVRERIYPFSDEGLIGFVFVLTIVLRFVSTTAGIVQSRYFTSIAKAITYRMREEVLLYLQNVSLKAYETMKSGALASRLVTDVETLDTFISVTVSKLAVSILIVLFSAVVLLWIDWKLGTFIVLTNPVVIFFTAKLARKTGELKRMENKAVERFQARLVETVDLIHQIRAANEEKRFFKRIVEEAEHLKRHAFAYGYRSDASQKLSYLVFLSGYELFRAVSIAAVYHQELSVGLMLAIFSYLWVMVSPTQDIIGFYYALFNAKSACKRIGTVYEYPLEPRYERKCHPFQGVTSVDITTKKIGFSFTTTPILKDVSIKIKAGSKVAIVGPSGSGKTTLAHILVGFYEPDCGDIAYGRCSYKKLGLRYIREHAHMILQHPKLFNATMRFNLTLGKPFDEERINEALRIAQLEDVVERLENGLDTLVGKDGVRLSGGQRQRVAIARMVLADPKIIVLDESTSALDVRTEARLFQALERFWQDKTVVIIAHRLSTIEKAQYVYVLESGRVTQEGTPKMLRQQSEGYFAMMI